MNVIKLTSPSDPAAEPYFRLTEAELKRAGDDKAGLFIAESIPVIKAALEAGYTPVSVLTEGRHIAAVEENLGGSLGETPVLTGEPGLLEETAGYRLHRGVLAAMRRKPLPSADETIAGKRRVAVLEGLIDPTNVGAIIRSAAALGMDAVLVSNDCCDPLNRRAARVSMGAAFRIPWGVLPKGDGKADAEYLKARGFVCAAAALSEGAVPITSAKLDEAHRLAVFIGPEGPGLSCETVAACDLSFIIPMAHGMDSLNAAAAAAVAFWVIAGSGV